MRPMVAMYHTWQVSTIVSSFFRLPLRSASRRVLQVGPLCGPSCVASSRREAIICSPTCAPTHRSGVLDVLRTSDREVRIYGLGERPPEGPLRFEALSEPAFVADLASCAALVGAAGNQTLGEALHLGKPVLALPEKRHHEQLINAHELERMGAGRAVTLESFAPHRSERVPRSARRASSRGRPYRGRLDGTDAARAEIERLLPERDAYVSDESLSSSIAVCRVTARASARSPVRKAASNRFASAT